jgi:hypothetical protein
MSTSDASDRRQIARMAAHASWAATPDRSARTAPARAALLARFEQQVDPEQQLTPFERQRRAEHARKAHFASLARKSAQVRRARRESGSATASTAVS